jgi:Holliday junction resolvase RusA-like endonuclease
MTPHSFRIDWTPPKATHQGSATILKDSRTGRLFTGKPKGSPGAKAKKQWIFWLAQYRPREPFTGPLEVQITITYPWRTKDPLKKRALGPAPMDTKPDLDNLLKLVLDAMTACRFWKDDNQVTDLKAKKRLGDRPGVKVTIQRPEPNDLNDKETQKEILFPCE